MRFNFHMIDNSGLLYKATAIYKVVYNNGELCCNLTNFKEALKRAKKIKGQIYKILQDENMNIIFNEFLQIKELAK